jgi:hypothetical protein
MRSCRRARRSVPGFPPQKSASLAQQDRIDDQQDFIRQPMFEERRGQCGAAREDEVRAVLRLDAANALDDVRSEALERSPCKAFRTVGRDIFLCRIEAVRHRAARRLGPETRPDVVGAAAKQQIEALSIRGEDGVPASGGPIGRGPVAVGKPPSSAECWITPSSEMCSMILSFLIGVSVLGFRLPNVSIQQAAKVVRWDAWMFL